jgi:carboxylesterase type B
MQDAWIAFARDADPRCDALPDWLPYRPARTTQWLDAECRVADDGRAAERAYWERRGGA